MKCIRCEVNEATVSAVVKGVYYKDLCSDCKADLASNTVSSGHARWERSIDLEDHEADIQQPYNSDGSINTQFAKLYPKQAAALFNEKQLRDASRN